MTAVLSLCHCYMVSVCTPCWLVLLSSPNINQKILRSLSALATKSSVRNASACPSSCSVSWLKPKAGGEDKDSRRATGWLRGQPRSRKGSWTGEGYGGLWSGQRTLRAASVQVGWRVYHLCIRFLAVRWVQNLPQLLRAA